MAGKPAFAIIEIPDRIVSVQSLYVWCEAYKSGIVPVSRIVGQFCTVNIVVTFFTDSVSIPTETG